MLARRILAAALAVVTVHLTVATPADACAARAHGEHAVPSIVMEHSASHDVMHGGESGQTPEPTSHTTPCCDAVTSCALTFAVSERFAHTAASPGAVQVRPFEPKALLSRAPVPEPPPPRA